MIIPPTAWQFLTMLPLACLQSGSFFKRLFSLSSSSDDVQVEQKPSPKPVQFAPPVEEEVAPPPTMVVKPLPSTPKQPQRKRASPPPESPKPVIIERSQFDGSRLRAALSSLQGVQRGDDLVTAASYDEALLSQVTGLVQEAIRLQHAAFVALAHRQNVKMLSDFFVAVVNMLDGNAQRLSINNATIVDKYAKALRKVRAKCREGAEVADTLKNPGWLIRMAKGEGMAEEFSHLHLSVLSLLKSEHLDTASPSGMKLPEPTYRDVGRQVRTLLKSVGNGSMEEGLVRLRDDLEQQGVAAAITDVSEESIRQEASMDPFFHAESTKMIEDGPARDAECHKVFYEYVTTASNAITADGFEKLMNHMGLLDKHTEYNRPAVARTALVAADADYDGALNFDEFRAFYGRYPISSVRHRLRTTQSLELENRVREAFLAFANFGTSKTTPRTPRSGPATPRSPSSRPGGSNGESEFGLNRFQFSKLVKDCGLVSWGMAAPHVDVVYTAAKGRDGRALDFDHFLAALVVVADRRGQSLDQVAVMVAEATGPNIRGTQNHFVRQHDDPSKMFGISTRGGPNTGPVNPDLSQLVDRSKRAPPLSLPLPRGSTPQKPQLTQPSSPRLSTSRRANNNSHGPTTPGRGVSLEAVEAKAAAKAASITSPRGPHAVFGRTCTPKAAEMASKNSSKKTSAKKAAEAAAAVEEEKKRKEQEARAVRQLFAPSSSFYSQEEPTSSLPPVLTESSKKDEDEDDNGSLTFSIAPPSPEPTAVSSPIVPPPISIGSSSSDDGSSGADANVVSAIVTAEAEPPSSSLEVPVVAPAPSLPQSTMPTVNEVIVEEEEEEEKAPHPQYKPTKVDPFANDPFKPKSSVTMVSLATLTSIPPHPASSSAATDTADAAAVEVTTSSTPCAAVEANDNQGSEEEVIAAHTEVENSTTTATIVPVETQDNEKDEAEQTSTLKRTASYEAMMAALYGTA